MAYADYAKDVQKGLGFRVAWPLNQPLRLGDVGFFESDGIFKRQDNLVRWKIPFKPRTGQAAAVFDYVSNGALTIDGKALASGERIALPAKGKVEVGFKRAAAVLLRLTRQVVREIEDKSAVGAEILEMHRTGGWERGHCVVVELMEAHSVAMLVSGSSDSHAVLDLDSGADAAGGIGIAEARGFEVSSVFTGDGAPITPLFRAQGVVRKYGFFGGASFRSGDDDGSQTEEWADIDPGA